MNFNRLKIFYSVLIFFPSFLKAQTDPYGQVSIASPTAASLGKYADIPVSYHTGIPQISVPFYTVKSGPLELPISLNYHASGLKVAEMSSWVGAGFSLDAGGVITRTVMGLPDEKGTGLGGVDLYGYFSDSGYNKYEYQSGTNSADWTGFVAGRKDGEPDLFFFNFGSYSGKFFFRDDHTPILVPQQDLKIIPYYPLTPTGPAISIQGFTVITPDGTQYFFGNTPGYSGNATEITNPYSSAGGYVNGIALSSWFLNKITSADGKFSIDLVYAPESYGYYTLSSNQLDNFSQNVIPELTLVKNIVTGVRLSQINFPNGSVVFNAGDARSDLSDNAQNTFDNINTSAKSLGSIIIQNNDYVTDKNNANSYCKKFLFYYGYFSDNTTPQPTFVTNSGLNLQNDKKRLRLDSIQEMSCDNLLQIPARKFSYFTDFVPRRINLGVDHWGFYNGVMTNTSLIPTYTTFDGSTFNTIAGGDRNAVWPKMRGGSLQTITYPTGGTTTFDFEAADSYTLNIPSQVMVPIITPNAHFHNTIWNPDPLPFTSNGGLMSFSATNNTQDIQAHIEIWDNSNTSVYSNFFSNSKYPAGDTTILSPITLLAGNYTVKLSFTIEPGSTNEGATVTISQLTTIITPTQETIGGLRIKTITHKESASTLTPIITSYTYPSGGFLYSFPTYVQNLRNDIIGEFGLYKSDGLGSGVFVRSLGSNLGCPLYGGYYQKSGGSLRPMSTTQGYHIGYPSVKVSQSGNGYSIYKYNTNNKGYSAQTLNPTIPILDITLRACDPNIPNYPAAPLPFDYKKGELYSEQHYNEAGELLKDAYYSSDYDLSPQLSTPAIIIKQTSSPYGTPIFIATKYDLNAPRITKKHIIETNYFPGQPAGIQQDTYLYYGSPYHNQVTRKVVSTSTNDNLITNTKYSTDFHLSNWDLNPSCEVAFNNNCNTCWANYFYADSVCGQDAFCAGDAILAREKCLSDQRNLFVNCRGTSNANYTAQHNSSKASASPELKPILDLQDSNRIVPIEVTDFRDSSLLKANFTRYDYSLYPGGIPYPNKTQLVNISNPSSTFTNAVISGNTLTKDSRYLDESSYSFLNGNVARVTGHDGLNSIYIWDYLNTNPIAKTISATTDTTAFSSFEADGTGNWNLSTGGGNTSQVSVNVSAAGSNLNLFTTQTPASVTENDHMPTVGQELGVKFTSSVAGTITGIRFYKTSGNTGTHIGELYSSTGTRLAQATFTGETATGWQTVPFTTPVSITANTTYTAAYFSSLGNYTEQDNYFLNNSVTNTPLTAAADGTYGASGTDPGSGQGTFIYTSTAAFPNQLYKSANYWVDVIFSPSTTPYANAGVNQTITLPTSTVVLNGSGSTGSITSYSWTQVSGPGTPVITSPTSTFTTVTGLTQGVYVFQLSVNSGLSTSQVTVNVLAAGTPTTVFTTQATPTSTLNDGQALEVGVKFRASTSGSITGIRFYKTTGNTGTHIGELYSYPGGTRLGQATFTGETSSGWQTVTFSTPISITANTTYIASYWSGSGNYSSTSNYYGNAITNGPLTALADGTDGHNSVYGYSTVPVFPTTYTTLFDQPNYWVDVMFLPDNNPVPSAGNNLSVTLPVSSVTLNGSNSTGSISNYLWTKVSGPGNPVIVSPTSANTSVTGLSAGSYIFQLAVNGASNSAFALTGTKSYNMTGNTVSKNGLTSGKKYIVSYWTRGSALNISGGISTSTVGRSVSGWTYYEHTLTMTSTTLTITGSGYIDELRLYPQGAQMSSYTYQPLVGITSMNDPNSEITYYEYDGLQRLKNIRDYQGNIVKNYQYNYAPPPGIPVAGTYTISMHTFMGTSTPSYPVGVFNINYKLIGNANNQAQYISLWMSDTTDSHTGALSVGYDSMHFQFNLYTGRTLPPAVLGLRYYQYDLAYNQIDAVTKTNCEYVDFGDGYSMLLGKTFLDTITVVLAPNTTSPISNYYVHNYPDTSLKTITFYHNDYIEYMWLQPYSETPPATSMTKLKNLRGYCPQNGYGILFSSYQQKSALSVDSIRNWSSIHSYNEFAINMSGGYMTTAKNLGFAQDFMQYNRGLQDISTAYGYPYNAYYDSTFKISRLKSDWNTYFTSLNSIYICDVHWNRENISGLLNLRYFYLVCDNHNHSNDPTGNSPVPIPSSVIDNLLIQIAAGSGQSVTNGQLTIISGGPDRTSASDTAYSFLISKGWQLNLFH